MFEATCLVKQPVNIGLVGTMIAITTLLSACSRYAGAGTVAGTEPIDCRASSAPAMARDCTVERMATPDGTALTVRNADGSFRRLLMVGDGRGVVAADGAEPAIVKAVDATSIEVAIGGMVYRLPARVTP